MRIKQETAKNMRSFRKHSGMTQALFGLVFEVTSQTVSNWENGRAKPSTLTWHTAMRIGESGRKHPEEMKILVQSLKEETIKHRPAIIARMVLLGGMSFVARRKPD